jgi:microcystin degradation protein MlrC
MVTAADALIAYRTNPHVDQRARGLEAAELMARTLRGQARPVQAAAMPPIVVSIEAQRTARPPARQLYELADQLLARPGVLSVSVVLGFAYADVEEMGSSVIVVADGERALAQAAADELAAVLWAQRADFTVRGLTVSEAIEQTRPGSADGPVGLLDVGDNVGGGSPGDGTLLLHALHARGCRAFVCLWDPESVAAAVGVGAGARCRLSMGGKSAIQPGGPLECDVTVSGLHDGRFTESQPRHGGMSAFNMGPTAVVRTDAGLTVMLTTNRVMPVSLGQLTCCGLDPRVFDAIVLKGVHAPAEAYEPVCSRLIQVDTPGPTSGNLAAFGYRHRRRPLYAFEGA